MSYSELNLNNRVMAVISYIVFFSLKIRTSQFWHSPIDKPQLLIPYSADWSLIDLSANALKFIAKLDSFHMQQKISLRRFM